MSIYITAFDEGNGEKMLSSYLQIFKAPGSLGFSMSGLLARLPMAMISVGLYTMISTIGDSYGTASYVAASYVIANALIAPQLSRLADQYGQTIITLIGSAISMIALSLLIYAATHHMQLWLLMLLAAFVGFFPSFGAFVRARWSKLYSGTPLLRTAFAYESLVDEMIFMIGPIIAVFLTTTFFPAAGPLAAVAFIFIGTFFFATQQKTQPKPTKNTIQTGGAIILNPKIALLTLILITVGSIFGTAEAGSLAYAESLGLKQYAFAPLVAYAAGSFIAGIIYGALKTRMTLQKQFLFLMIIAALTTLPLLFVYDLRSLSLALFIAGAACSPTIIVSMALVEAVLPSSRLTEGMTWAVTGLSIGVAGGMVLAGILIDNFTPELGFQASIIGGFSALILTIIGYRILKVETTMREIV